MLSDIISQTSYQLNNILALMTSERTVFLSTANQKQFFLQSYAEIMANVFIHSIGLGSK